MMQTVEFDVDELRAVARSLSTSYDAQLKKLRNVDRHSRVWVDTYDLHAATDAALTKVQDAVSVAVLSPDVPDSEEVA